MVSNQEAYDTALLLKVPLTALSKDTLRQLSNLISPRKILRSEEGYERDCRGLALLAEQNNFVDDNIGINDPTEKVIQLWSKNNPKTATFSNLVNFLGVIDRWDVCDDLHESLLRDAANYHDQKNRKTFFSSDTTKSTVQLDNQFNENILTKDDVFNAQNGLPLKIYNAFVMYAETDINYARELITKLEQSYGLQLFDKVRDLLAGTCFTHITLTQMIEERCHYVIVILTDDFLKSPENKFLVNYSQALQIENRTRKIIPLLYDNSSLPKSLKMYTYLEYNNTHTLYDFWDKLADSIKKIPLSAKSI